MRSKTQYSRGGGSKKWTYNKKPAKKTKISIQKVSEESSLITLKSFIRNYKELMVILRSAESFQRHTTKSFEVSDEDLQTIYPKLIKFIEKEVKEAEEEASHNQDSNITTLSRSSQPRFVIEDYISRYNIYQIQSYLRPIKEALVFNLFSRKATLNFNPEYETSVKLKNNLEREFREKLYPFQKKGIEFGIKRMGRIIIGDEMGVGKTIQALGLLSVYRSNLPCLILCPSVLKFNWKREAEKWLDAFLVPTQIVILTSKRTTLYPTTKILIVSYDMAKDISKKLMDFKFQMVIADEAHALKGLTSKRSKELIPLINSCKRCFLLTGTPALNRPIELFNLLKCVRPDIFRDHTVFGKRYCDPMLNPYGGGLSYNGCDNTQELNFIISRFMIRRLKKEVLQDLPDKQRIRIEVEVDEKVKKQMKMLEKQIENQSGSSGSLERAVRGMIPGAGAGMAGGPGGEGNAGEGGKGSSRHLITKLYSLTGESKIPGIKEFLIQLLDYKTEKYVVFCHHAAVIDALSKFLTSKKVGYVTITGKVKGTDRQQAVDDFQTPLTAHEKSTGKGGVRVALLSITAAATGLTLTQSSTVIFAELYWTPGIVVQAEDRVHRISQENNVTIYYLIGKATIDKLIYTMIQNKVRNLGKVMDGGKNDEFEAKEVKMEDAVGKFRKTKQRDSKASLDARSGSGKLKQAKLSFEASPEIDMNDKDFLDELDCMLENNPELVKETKAGVVKGSGTKEKKKEPETKPVAVATPEICYADFDDMLDEYQDVVKETKSGRPTTSNKKSEVDQGSKKRSSEPNKSKVENSSQTVRVLDLGSRKNIKKPSNDKKISVEELDDFELECDKLLKDFEKEYSKMTNAEQEPKASKENKNSASKDLSRVTKFKLDSQGERNESDNPKRKKMRTSGEGLITPDQFAHLKREYSYTAVRAKSGMKKFKPNSKSDQ